MNWEVAGEDVLKIIMQYKNTYDNIKIHEFITNNKVVCYKCDFIKVIKYYNKTKGYKMKSKNYLRFSGKIDELRYNYLYILDTIGVSHFCTFNNLIFIE